MNARAGRVFILVLLLFSAIAAAGVLAAPQAPTQATPQPGSFVGRWEVWVQTSDARPANMPKEIPFFLVEIAGSGSSLTGKLIDVMGAPSVKMEIGGVSIKGDQLEMTIEMAPQKIVFTGKRVDDHIEGTATASNDPAKWIGRPTTKDKLPDMLPLMAAARGNQSADQQAYSMAMDIGNPTQRMAALQKFLADYPNSPMKDEATLQIALSKQPPYKAAALQEIVDKTSEGHLREQAQYELTRTMPAGRDRIAAEEKFMAAYPRSSYRATIFRSWFDNAIGHKPVDEARANTAIEGMLEGSPNQSLTSGPYMINPRSSMLNTIADRLMVNEAMLDRALALIEEAVKLDGDKASPDTRTIHLTTLGEVQFKLKKYDEAGESLLRAVQISGHDGDGETQLFLGKYYEVKKQEEPALQAYMKAAEMGAPLDTKECLERLYVKRYGDISSLEKKLDDIYRAKGVGFDPGHYVREATPGPVRVVLAELFTGAECAPCVSADLAFDGIDDRYDKSTIATLVYHLHIPGPDPMTNADTLARAKYYGTNATPTAVFDGGSKKSGGGDRAMAQMLFKDYSGVIEKRLSTAPLASLDNFKAQLTGSSIAVSGDAKLLSGATDRAAHVVLHVALAETDVSYMGSNGVRVHNLVVRQLIGGPQGQPFAADTSGASMSQTIDLTSVTSGLNDYLASYEKTRGSFKFKARPTAIDPAKVVVVAFVQDDQTKEILQAVVVTPAR